MRKIKQNGIYKHFKGDYMYVIGVGKHTETMEDVVVYTHKGKIWVRPIDMFLGEVDHKKYPDVKQKYRFEEVDKED